LFVSAKAEHDENNVPFGNSSYRIAWYYYYYCCCYYYYYCSTIVRLVKSRDEKVKDYSRCASIRESISGDASMKGARRKEQRQEKKRKRRRGGPHSRKIDRFPVPPRTSRLHANTRVGIRYASLGVSQDGINYPRISTLLRLSLFVFFSSLTR